MKNRRIPARWLPLSQVISLACLFAGAAEFAFAAAAVGKEEADARTSDGSLIPNADFEQDSHSGAWAQDWGGPKEGVARLQENGNYFIRLQSTEPGKHISLYKAIGLPAEAEALALSWRWRITNLKRGEEKQYDARIILEFKDAEGKPVTPRPNPAYTTKVTEGWETRTSRFLVPEGAVTLELKPSLFRVARGTMDIDDIVLAPTDSSAVRAEVNARKRPADPPVEEPRRENWPQEIKVSGNKLVNADGEPVWLQGVNVASLEWTPKGESVLNSIQVAIDKWQANVVRLPLKNEHWDGPESESYRALVDAAITMAANRGAYIVIDLHHYRAPKEAHVKFWTDFATLYKNHPAVLFDLLNEPHGISWEVWRNGGFVEERTKKADEDAFLADEEKAVAKQGFESPGMQALVEAVRSTGAKNVIIAGALDYAYDLSGILQGYALDDKSGNGIMYSSHVYPWKRGWQRSFLDVAEHYPIFVGEVGAAADKVSWIPASGQEDAETWVPEMLGLIQKHKLNWTGWCFHPNAGPRMLLDWSYTPTPAWGEPAKRALGGEQFELKKLR